MEDVIIDIPIIKKLKIKIKAPVKLEFICFEDDDGFISDYQETLKGYYKSKKKPYVL